MLLNTLFQEMHEIVEPGFIEEVSGGTLNGTEITDGLLVGAGLALQIPLAMVVLSRVLSPRINRWANTATAAVMAIGAVSTIGDPDDVLFAIAKITGLVAIVAIVWRTQRAQQRASR